MGKTSLSIELARQFNGEVISGDSMQVYKGMDIGTAKVTPAEMAGIPHHMIDILDPCESFTAADFQERTKSLIETVHTKGKLPLIVGGSGLYIQSVLYDYDFSNEIRNPAVTERLRNELEEKGAEVLHARLSKIDPIQAEKVHPNNHRRLIRALEVFETTGKPMSDSGMKKTSDGDLAPYIIGLGMERTLLYERINQRVDKMVEEGLVEEVQRLVSLGYENCRSMRGIGYKEIIPYIKGETTLAEAIEQLKQNSRRFAKRQYTWFRNKMDVNWFEITPQTALETFKQISAATAGFLEETENNTI